MPVQIAEPHKPRRVPRPRHAADPGLYRKEASRLRRRAKTADNDQIRLNLIKIAEEYEQLADAIDTARWR